MQSNKEPVFFRGKLVKKTARAKLYEMLHPDGEEQELEGRYWIPDAAHMQHPTGAGWYLIAIDRAFMPKLKPALEKPRNLNAYFGG